MEIAYLIARSHWGVGLATEAARAIRDYGFGRLGQSRLVSIIHRDNLASRRVAEKAGLHPERQVQFMNHRCWLYAIEQADRRERDARTDADASAGSTIRRPLAARPRVGLDARLGGADGDDGGAGPPARRRGPTGWSSP